MRKINNEGCHPLLICQSETVKSKQGGWQPKVLIKTFGCQMNVRDSELIAGLLASKGYKVVDSDKDADVILFNTCSVRKHAEDKVWSEIGTYKRPAPSKFAKANLRRGDTRPNKKIIGLVGCMAEYHKYEAFKKAPSLDFVCGPNNIASIPFLIKQSLKESTKGLAVGQRERDPFVYKQSLATGKDDSFVIIAEGCQNFCSYCVVPLVRGIERSRHPEEILEEIKGLISKGVKDITLLGQNVNSYKFENVDFTGLLEMVQKLEGLRTVGFFTSHPKDASKKLFKAMVKYPKIRKLLHMPIQSGSDRILKLMNRGYTVKEYLQKVRDYRKIVNGALSTDIIVGFPSETKRDFEKTEQIFKKLRFNAAYIFKYSPRPHTRAFELKDDVKIDEKKRRHRILLDLQKKISKEKT